jgi:gamma-glutamyltranspeptidase
MFKPLPDGEAVNFLNSIGPAAIAIPEQVAGVSHLLETWGTMDFGQVSARTIA